MKEWSSRLYDKVGMTVVKGIEGILKHSLYSTFNYSNNVNVTK
jgi:hypothetical protein